MPNNAQYGSPESIAYNRKRANRNAILLILGAIFYVMVYPPYQAWINVQFTGEWAPQLSVTEVVAEGNTDLCPGEALTIAYTIENHGRGIARVEVDAVAWSVEPPQTTIYSIPMRTILKPHERSRMRESWIIPTTLLSRHVADWTPGAYQWRLTFGNVYEAATPIEVEVPFNIAPIAPSKKGLKMNPNSEPRPQPVMNASYLSGLLITLVMSCLAMLSGLGIVQWDTAQQSLINAFVTAAINVAIVVFTMRFGAAAKVTPVESPRVEVAGELVPLVRADTGQPVPGDRLF